MALELLACPGEHLCKGRRLARLSHQSHSSEKNLQRLTRVAKGGALQAAKPVLISLLTLSASDETQRSHSRCAMPSLHVAAYVACLPCK